VIERDELAAWLRLLETTGVGRESARRLLAAFGSAEAVFTASPAQWRTVVSGNVAAALAAAPEGFDDLLERTWAWLRSADGVPRELVRLGDPQYPQALLESADPPLLLYLQGRAGLLKARSIAVVGSRNPTAQGLDNARAFARMLSRGGWTVVSGLALGIDAAAHEGALDGSGATIAVVGTGLDQTYPRRHHALAQRIAEHGLIVSEYSIGTPALPAHFPVRNRIIAGLARGTLVVEAALQSGSLITARMAVESGREVFAIPGSIHSPQSRGCHQLIKQGAKLVETSEDMLEELGADARTPMPEAPAATPAKRDPVLEALGYDPMSLDALIDRTGWPAHELSARLLELELEGQVARLPGQRFQRRGQA
jgi:DNA processing protein